MASVHTIPAGAQLDTVLENTLIGFRRTTLSLEAFSLAYQDVPLKGSNKMLVPYYPIHTEASANMAVGDTYSSKAKNTSFEMREVTINKHKVQAISFYSEDVSRQPAFDPATHGLLMGDKLALDVIADILSVVTAANYGAPILTSASADFDVMDLFDLGSTLDEAYWPEMGRKAILKPAYYKGVVTSDAVLDASQSSDPAVLRTATFREAAGFSLAKTMGIPANGENLVGFVNLPSAILVGFAPVEPTAPVRANMTDYRVVRDDYTGTVLEYREFGIADSDMAIQVIECHYGYGFGEAAALKRIVSA
jgi:hypothetical protein